MLNVTFTAMTALHLRDGEMDGSIGIKADAPGAQKDLDNKPAFAAESWMNTTAFGCAACIGQMVQLGIKTKEVAIQELLEAIECFIDGSHIQDISNFG